MKKIGKILLISFSFLAITVNYTYAQLGIQMGYAYTLSKGNLELGTFGEYTGTFRNSGFQGGLIYDFKIKGDLGLQTGILYSIFAGNTTESEKTAYGITGDLITTSSYQFLDLPLRVTYLLPVTNEFRIKVFGGPNFTYALSGWSKSAIQDDYLLRRMPKYENVFKDFKNDLLRFDVKLGLGLGIEYNQIGFKIGYDFGLLNGYNGLIEKNSNDEKYKVRRGQLGVSLYFLLWK